MQARHFEVLGLNQAKPIVDCALLGGHRPFLSCVRRGRRYLSNRHAHPLPADRRPFDGDLEAGTLEATGNFFGVTAGNSAAWIGASDAQAVGDASFHDFDQSQIREDREN